MPDRSSRSTRTSVRSAANHWSRALLVLVMGLLALGLSGCQVKVAVDAKVDSNGAGTLSVGVGLDEKAVARVGDLNAQVKTDDLRAAGWSVATVAKEADGLTWLRASKGFANADELNRVIAELTGPDAMFKGFKFEKVETDSEITYRLTGTVDSTKGVATFADPDLAAQLNGDPFGGQVAKIEAEEGKPVADMVTFDVTASVNNAAPTAYHPTLRDKQATAINVSAVDVKPPPAFQRVGLYLLVAVGLVVLIVMLVGVRRRFTSGSRY